MSQDLEKTKAFLARLWAMQEVERPAFRLAGWNREPFTRPAPPPEVDDRFEALFCRQATVATETLGYDDDGLPILNSYMHIGVHASAFGSPVLRQAHGEPQVLPIIRGPEDFARFRDPADSDETRLTLDYLGYLNRHRQPGWIVTQADTQGPTDTASLIWDYTDMLVSAMTDTDKVERVLAGVTDYIIEFAHRQQAIIPDLNLNHNPGVYLPPGMGISASEDLIAVVSPDWYRRFGLPYNNRLSEAFGGIFVHSCGNFTQNLGVLTEHHNLRGVNFNLGEVEIPPLLDALAGKCVLVPRLALKIGEDKLRQYVGYLDKHGLDRTHHFYAIDNDGRYTLDQAMAVLRELGIAPRSGK